MKLEHVHTHETSASANQLHIPALSTAPLIATEPSRGAGTAARLPLKDPIGVRAALTINTSWNHKSSQGHAKYWDISAPQTYVERRARGVTFREVPVNLQQEERH